MRKHLKQILHDEFAILKQAAGSASKRFQKTKLFRMMFQAIWQVPKMADVYGKMNIRRDRAYSKKLLSQIRLTGRLPETLQECLIHDEFVISINHSDYTKVVAGVEIMIMDEEIAYNSRKISYLNIFPILESKLRLVSDDEPFYVGINCNGKRIGVADTEGLLSAIDALFPAKLQRVIIHHTKGFDLALIAKLLAKTPERKARFWLHDNFSLCPNYTLLRNDIKYCGAPDVDSYACRTCKYGHMRKLQQQLFAQFFKDNKLEIAAPSKFTLNLWIAKSAFKGHSAKVIPHLRLSWRDRLPAHEVGTTKRIGFVGYPVYWKGWETWLRLVGKYFTDDRYRFFCFTSWGIPSERMTQVDVSVSRESRMSMVEALVHNKIDVAFLWSLCPETFSFTLYESIAAGCFVLTNRDSGNIGAYVKENPDQGFVLRDEGGLFSLFSGDSLEVAVTNYQRSGKARADLVFLPEFELST